MARFYLLACFAGAPLPFAAFSKWITHHGISPILLITTIWRQPLALFASLDVIVTALVLIIFADIQGRRIGMSHRWVPPLQPAAWDPHLGYRYFFTSAMGTSPRGNLLLSTLQPEWEQE